VLQLKSAQSVWQLERLRFTQGEPMSIQASYLPVAIAPELNRQPLDREHLVDILRDAYGVQLGSATEYVNPTVADAYAARLLSVPLRAPLFQIERTTYTVTGAVVEYRRALLRGDVYRYRIELR
jgi:GntR family transcriptional regulator